MDAVRFGRALGLGARQAVKTVASAVDAAAAENPSAKSASGAGGTGAASAQSEARPAVKAAAKTAARTAARTLVEVKGAHQGLMRGSKRFGEAVWGPFVRLSGVLWLEVSGVFFGIFALFAAAAVWRFRGGRVLTVDNASEHRSFEGAVVMLAVFGYFCISSFFRARRRERRR